MAAPTRFFRRGSSSSRALLASVSSLSTSVPSVSFRNLSEGSYGVLVGNRCLEEWSKPPGPTQKSASEQEKAAALPAPAAASTAAPPNPRSTSTLSAAAVIARDQAVLKAKSLTMALLEQQGLRDSTARAWEDWAPPYDTVRWYVEEERWRKVD
ncbi:hypothetical protein JCM10207_005522 [Rhodosporidiobolus poonsookiae]